MYSEKNEPAHDIVFNSYMGEQITHCKIIRVWVRWWTTSIVHRCLYDSHYQLLESWSADPAENGPGIALTTIGGHGLDRSNEFINRATKQPV
jgi:hypothetical protein